MRTKAGIMAILLAVLFFALSLIINTESGNSDKVAAKVSQRLEKRMEILAEYMSGALEEGDSQWSEIEDLPEDMVIYRYVYDTLQSWSNQFPVLNDDIGSRLIFYRLSNLRGSMSSPLSEA